MKKSTLILTLFALWPLTACWAQITRADILHNLMDLSPNEAGVSMGHWHTIVRDVDATKQFWTLLGGTPIKMDGADVIKFHGVLIFLQKGEPSGGTVGTTVDHIGVRVPDGEAFVAKLKAAGVKTDPGAGARNQPSADGAFRTSALAMAFGYVYSPDDLRIEILGDENLTLPVIADHIHLYAVATAIPEMQAWYAKTFGGLAYTDTATNPSNPSASVNIPGVRLKWPTYSTPSSKRLPTKGRALDHIGFEVKNLDVFCKKLQSAGVRFDKPFSTTRHASYASAEFTDPWGTSIELTEGLRR